MTLTDIAGLQPTVAAKAVRLPMSEVIAAMSRALDLTEGQPLGHSIRSCMIGMELGRAMGLNEYQLSELYYALLLKDAGCSSNAARMAALFGSDDLRIKPRMKVVDWDDRPQLAKETWRNTAIGGTLGSRINLFFGLVRQKNVTRELIAARCERGADIAARLGFPEGTVSAIRSLDEHWNGNGHPAGLRGDEIPFLSRIVNVAQTMDVFLSMCEDPQAADAVLLARRGQWFDPILADAACELLRDDRFRKGLRSPDLEARVVALEPAAFARVVDDKGLDEIARAFADIIDAKSPWTFRHSEKVALYARAIGGQMGFDERALRNIYRAGLLHDIGKLGVSSRILDKNGKLTTSERAEIEHHPVHTWEILRRVSAFEEFAMQAATHHEKLDGSGYPWGRMADDLDVPARVLAVADVFEAATADRPYRSSVTVSEALQILNSQSGLWLDPDAVEALAASVEEETDTQDL
jgi:putative nucleotidyltransferase with HDIG domain